MGKAWQPYLTPKGLKTSAEYDPEYLPFDKALQAAEHLRAIFERFHELDKGMTAETTNQGVKDASKIFEQNMFKDGNELVDGIEQNLIKFDKEHAVENNKLYQAILNASKNKQN